MAAQALQDHALWADVVVGSLSSRARKFISVGSHQQILWTCSTCSTEWKDEVRLRVTKKYGCPTCFGRTMPGNRLSKLRPDLAQEWHPTKNNSRTPDNVHSKADLRVWWLGSECGHEWVTNITNRTVLGYGCPYCSNKLFSEGVNDISTQNLPVLKEWDYSKNSIAPTQAFQNSVKHWWKCSLGHEWSASVSGRMRGSGCPKCAKLELSTVLRNRSILKSGSLEVSDPDIASEWDYAKNVLLPSEVSVSSGITAHWICRYCGFAWETSVACRVMRASNCRECFSKSSKVEEEFLDFVRKTTRAEVLRNYRALIPPKEVDVYVPTLQIAFEFNGNYWHSDAKFLSTRKVTAEEVHREKLLQCGERGVKLYFVWESDWKESRDEVEDEVSKILAGRYPEGNLLNCLSMG